MTSATTPKAPGLSTAATSEGPSPATRPPVQAWISIGGNLGDSKAIVLSAVEVLRQRPDILKLDCSPLYLTAPVLTSGPDFVNAVLRIETHLLPLELLDLLQAVELQFGRERPFPNAPRTLDLDLMTWGDVTLDTPRLTLPHPRLHLRAFVLRPWLDLWPDAELPGLGPMEPWLRRLQFQALKRLDD